ncbi:hypothetical protein ACWIWK_04860 [Helicobacter sp. 23-1048]
MFALVVVLSALYLFVGNVVNFIFLKVYGIKDYTLLGFGIESRAQKARKEAQIDREIAQTFGGFSDSALLNKRMYNAIEIALNKLLGIDIRQSMQEFMEIKTALLQSQAYNDKITKGLKLKYTIAFVLFAISLIPINLHTEQSYNTFEIIYTFFDSPSVFCVLLSMLFVTRCVLGDMFRFSWIGYFIEQKMRPQDSTMLILSVFGVVLYLGACNILPFDVYHLGIWQSGFITLCVVVLIGFLDSCALVLLFFTICVYVFFGFDLSLAEFVICPYLWLYSVIFTCIYFAQRALDKH